MGYDVSPGDVHAVAVAKQVVVGNDEAVPFLGQRLLAIEVQAGHQIDFVLGEVDLLFSRDTGAGEGFELEVGVFVMTKLQGQAHKLL